MKGIWSEAAHGRFWLISNSVLIENEKNLVWGSPRQILIDFQLNSNWKWKEIGLSQRKADSDWFLIKF